MHDSSSRLMDMYARSSSNDLGAGYRAVLGRVTRACCGGYDCFVQVGAWEIPCFALSIGAWNGFGVTDGYIPLEGSTVVVLTGGSAASIGYILGAVPNSRNSVPKGWSLPKSPSNTPNDDFSPLKDNSAYLTPYKGDRSRKHWAGAGRPKDMVPGDYVVVNENRVGLAATMYDVELSAGASFVRVGAIDDEVRIRATNFTKWTDAGAVSEFNDAGRLSSEGREYSYQNEALGDSGGNVVFGGYERPSAAKDKEPRPRTRWWKGFLGSVFSWFAVRPRKSPSEEDAGLASVHAGQTGNIMVRAAGGVSLERYDRIPVPHRLKEPWDPAGDSQYDVENGPHEPFTTKDPHARALELSSRMAWDQKAMYRRFDELKKDFRVQQESAVAALSDEDGDPFESKGRELSKYDGRRAGVFIGDDGSIIMRDAWGSEIVMLGGNVSINTPGTVMVAAHNDVVSMAGRSFVAMGSKAAEMSSENGSARVHAKRLVAIAGGTDSTDGGVLIESLAKSPALSAEKEGGDAASVGGVVIRAEESAVSISGKKAYLLGNEAAHVVGGGEGEEMSGDVYVCGKNVISSASGVLASVADGSGLIATDSSAVVSSKGSSLMTGESGAIVVNGQEVPILWDSGGEVPSLTNTFENIYRQAQDSRAMEPFTWDGLSEKALFSFRKSSESGTDSGGQPKDPTPEFRVYQPHWQVMSESGDPMASSTPSEMAVEDVRGTRCWPGKDAFDSGKFVKLSSGNVEKGLSKDRDSLSPSVELSEEPYSSFKL